jgi:DNA-binding transcriptional ArsR family regulator
MKAVVLEVGSLTDSVAAATRAWKIGKAEGAARISFASAELLWKVLTAKRLEILKAMTGAGGLTIREIAHRVGRDGTNTEASDPAGLSHCATSAHASHGGVACAVQQGARRRMEIRPAP